MPSNHRGVRASQERCRTIAVQRGGGLRGILCTRGLHAEQTARSSTRAAQTHQLVSRGALAGGHKVIHLGYPACELGVLTAARERRIYYCPLQLRTLEFSNPHASLRLEFL